jgi:predicted flavoprotein YhiN
MDLSEPVARAQSEGRRTALRLVLDLAPPLEREALRQRLIEAGGRAGAPALGRVLVETLGLPRRIVLALLAQAGAERSVRANALDRATRHAVVEAAKGLCVPVDGTLGFDRAEVTAGGLHLRAVDPATMAVRGHPGLFVCGELLDLAGPIGGLNFQAAFATAELAAAACARPSTG